MGASYEEILREMEDTYTNLAGVKPADASDIGIRLKILAEQISRLAGQLEQAQRDAFPQTAQGEWLERHAAQRGLVRKPAVPATGTVAFSRTSPAEKDLPIPEGSAVASKGEKGLLYLTVSGATLRKGEQSANVPVQCAVPGRQGNLAAGMIGAMVSPAPGIAEVSNPQPISGGEDEETDDALRSRLLKSYHPVTNGTNQAFYYNMAMQYPGVSSVKVLPRINGIGTVGIVAAGQGVNSALLNRMKKEIASLKEVNVDLSVEQAQNKGVAVSAEIAVKDGYSFADTAALCREAVTELAKMQGVGQPLFIAGLIQALLGCEGVANCRIVSPAADVYPLDREILLLSQATITEMAVQAG